MKTKTPEHEKNLKRLLKLLRAQGVKYYCKSDDVLTIELLETLPVEQEAPVAIPRQPQRPEFDDLDVNNPEHLDVLLANAR